MQISKFYIIHFQGHKVLIRLEGILDDIKKSKFLNHGNDYCDNISPSIDVLYLAFEFQILGGDQEGMALPGTIEDYKGYEVLIQDLPLYLHWPVVMNAFTEIIKQEAVCK